MNKDKNTMYQYTWEAAKTVLRGEQIAVHAYIRNEKMYQINNLRLYLRKLGEK